MESLFDGLRVFSDPGHGDENLGCMIGDVHEKDWTLQMAQDVGVFLGHLGVKQLFSRQADINPGFNERADLALDFGAHLSLIHHVNASSNRKRSGTICYCYPREKSLKASYQIMHCSVSGLRRRGGKIAVPGSRLWTPGAQTVLGPYEARGLDAVLIEYGFSTNERDVEILLSAKHRPSLVLSAAAGVTRMMELHPSSQPIEVASNL
jgi:N-acetylmuramoyl-L-alanine amidase